MLYRELQYVLQDANVRAVLTTDEHMSRMAPLAEEAGAKILRVSDSSKQLSSKQAGSLQCAHLGHCSVVYICVRLADMYEQLSVSFDQTQLGSDRLSQRYLNLQDAIDALKPEQGALVVYTSGTTGRPKGDFLPVISLVLQHSSYRMQPPNTGLIIIAEVPLTVLQEPCTRMVASLHTSMLS